MPAVPTKQEQSLKYKKYMIQHTTKKSLPKFQTVKKTTRRTIPVPTVRHLTKPKGEEVEMLRIVPLGGLEEVGRNSMFFEYKNEIVIIDMGIQFPEEETPGIDFIIPNTTYLESKKANIKGIVVTHGHLDHIGAIPYLLGRLGNPPIYTTALTKEMIARRQEEFPNAPKPNFVVVKNEDRVTISEHFSAEFFGVSHTIPDTTGVVLKTPAGNIVNCADFRIDYDANGGPMSLNEFEKIGKMGIDVLLLDSTNAEVEGKSISERDVERNIEKLFEGANGRIILATFSSMLTRIAEILRIAEKIGRTVAINGFSMKANVQIAQNLGYIKVKKGLVIPVEEIKKLRDDKILVLTTGAQGESNAGLMRIVSGEHQHLEIKPGDTVIFSSSVIPGNERSVQTLKDNLARQGAKVHTSKMLDIHSSGHAPKEELKQVIKLINPKYLIPIHGYYFMRFTNAELGQEVGMPKERTIVMDNGEVFEMSSKGGRITSERIDAYYVMVDGLGVGDVEEVVLRDRKMLASEGMIVVIITLAKEGARLLKNPDIISRGFIYLRENQELLEEMRRKIKNIIIRMPKDRPLDDDYLKTLIRDQVGQYVYVKTKRRPMVLPVIIGV